MREEAIFINGTGPYQGRYIIEYPDEQLELGPMVLLPPPVGWPTDGPDIWVQVHAERRRTEVDGDWLPIYTYLLPESRPVRDDGASGEHKAAP